MAAVTGVITALAGIGMTAYQAYDANEQKKDAAASAAAAKAALKGINEQNPYADVQVPDISSLAFDQIARSEAGAINALQGLGADGAAQVVNVLQAGKESSLQASQAQAGMEYQRNAAEAEAQKEINARKVARDTAIATGELEGAQRASAAAKAQQQQALVDTVSGVGNLATGLGQATSLEAKAQRGERKNKTADFGYTPPEGADQINAIYTELNGNLDQILNTY